MDSNLEQIKKAIEVEAKYEGVEVRPDGTVELMLYGGKTVIKKLKG